MWVMITGIRSIDDTLKAWEMGVDALGLLVGQANIFNADFISSNLATSITQHLSPVAKSAPSFRMIAQRQYESQSFALAKDDLNLCPKPPPGGMERFCESVLVTHLTDVQKIISSAKTTGVTTIQLVGNTTPQEANYIKETLHGIKVIKSLPVLGYSCMDEVKKYMDIVDAIELDTIDIATNKFGGTGKTHNWDISKKIVLEYGYKMPIILAGGLHADNIEEALQTVKPFGVDVSSGINYQDGINEQNERLTKFLSNAKYFQY
jgi:phosphoribosylanthranilate isomerase